MRRLLPCLIACLALILAPAASVKHAASRTLRVVSPFEIGGVD